MGLEKQIDSIDNWLPDQTNECVLFSRLLLKSDQIWHSIVIVVSDLAYSPYCNQESNSSKASAHSLRGMSLHLTCAHKVDGGYCIIVHLTKCTIAFSFVLAHQR